MSGSLPRHHPYQTTPDGSPKGLGKYSRSVFFQREASLLPSPPLSTTASPITFHPPDSDPWVERILIEPGPLRDRIMELSTGSVSGLEGSWRMEGDLSPVRRGQERELWDNRDPEPEVKHLEAERRAKSPTRILNPIDLGLGMDKGGVPSVAVMASMMDTTKGRDKVLKCVQYSLRTYLYLLSLVARFRPLPPWFRSNSIRVRLAVTGLSLTRKCLLLLNPLHPLTHLLSPAPTSASTLIRHLIDLTSALADDIYCLSRLGLVGRRTGRIADRWANRFWFLTTILALYTLQIRTIPRLRSNLPAQVSPAVNEVVTPSYVSREMSDARWTNRKLLADLTFVSYDVFQLQIFKEPVQCIAGLFTAFISSTKLYDQHWRASLGKG